MKIFFIGQASPSDNVTTCPATWKNGQNSNFIPATFLVYKNCYIFLNSVCKIHLSVKNLKE